jgi:hypothetical protein
MEGTTSILSVLNHSEDQQQIEVEAHFKVTVGDLRKAIVHGREKGWTNERDNEWSALIVGALLDGAITADLIESAVNAGPKALIGL